MSLKDFSQVLYHPYLLVTFVEVHVEFLVQFILQKAHFIHLYVHMFIQIILHVGK